MDKSIPLSNALKKVGLSDKAILVYGYLLEKTEGYPSKIAEELHLNRSTVYNILVDLSIKGFVNEIQNGKKLFYQVDKPSKILRYAEQQVKQAEELENIVKQASPELERLYINNSQELKTFYYKGKDRVQSIYDDHLRTKKGYEMLAIGDTDSFISFLDKSFYKKYREGKQKKKITTRSIHPKGLQSKDKISTVYRTTASRFVPKMRFLQRTKFPFKGEITIYGDDRVSIINLDEKNVTGVIIQDKQLHQMMRTLFDFAWDAASDEQ